MTNYNFYNTAITMKFFFVFFINIKKKTATHLSNTDTIFSYRRKYMLVTQTTTKIWEDKFNSKFLNFCKKSPILLSILEKIQDGEKGILITHVNTNSKYFFPFDYDMDVKDFIANIKKVLVENHYPRVIEQVLDKHEKTPEELAIEVENGTEIKNLKAWKMKVVGDRLYRIDKILAWKNIAILTLEKSTFENDKVGTSYRFKYNGSLVIFLKNYRSGKFSSLEQASETFFSNSLLIDELSTTKDGTEN